MCIFIYCILYYCICVLLLPFVTFIIVILKLCALCQSYTGDHLNIFIEIFISYYDLLCYLFIYLFCYLVLCIFSLM